MKKKNCTLDNLFEKEIKEDMINNYGFSKEYAKEFARDSVDAIVSGVMVQYLVELQFAFEMHKSEQKDYILICDTLEPELCTESRIIEYAQNRLEANPEDKKGLIFDAENMNIIQACSLIKLVYGEIVFNIKEIS